MERWLVVSAIVPDCAVERAMQELMGWRKHDKVTVAVEQARGFRKLVRIGFYVFQNVDVKNRVETAILWNARDRSSNDLRRRTRRSLRSAHRYSSGEQQPASCVQEQVDQEELDRECAVSGMNL